jgi:hypothetical protein
MVDIMREARGFSDDGSASPRIQLAGESGATAGVGPADRQLFTERERLIAVLRTKHQEGSDMAKGKKKRGSSKQTRIPGTERKDVNKEIEKLAAKYVEIRDERMNLTEHEVVAKAALVAAMDANKLTTYRCDDNDLAVEVIDVHNVKVRKVPQVDGDAGEDESDEAGA